MSEQSDEAFKRLKCLTESILRECASEGAADFDVDAWLQAWVDRPQPALGAGARSR